MKEGVESLSNLPVFFVNLIRKTNPLILTYHQCGMAIQAKVLLCAWNAGNMQSIISQCILSPPDWLLLNSPQQIADFQLAIFAMLSTSNKLRGFSLIISIFMPS